MRKLFNFDSLNSKEVRKNQAIIISILMGLLLFVTIIYLLSTDNKPIISDMDQENKINFSNSLKIDAEKECRSRHSDG